MSEVVGKAPCPACRKVGRDHHGDNLVLYSDGHGYCFSCGAYYGESPKGELRREAKDMSLIQAGDFIPLSKRGISKETCEKFGYTVGEFKGTPVQIAPYHDEKGNLIAQHVRFPNKDFIWKGEFSNATLWGQHLWAEKGKRVIVTEGEIDAMSISQLQGNKWPVVSIPSGAQGARKAITKSLEWLESFEEVVLCFDMDEPGRKAVQEVAPLFSPGKARVVSMPLKDANDMLRTGRSQELISSLWSAKPFRPDGIVNGQDILETILKEPEVGLELPYPKLQEMTLGMRKGELWLFTAGSGIGKSTLVHELGYHMMMEHDKSIGEIIFPICS